MAKSTAWRNGILALELQNIDFTLLGDAGGIRQSVTAGFVYIGLHTADPGAGGDQTTNEATYTGYARKAVARSNAEFSVSVGVATNLNAELFALCTAGSNTITHWSIGVASAGAGKLMYFGALPSSLPVSANIQPNVAVGALTVTET